MQHPFSETLVTSAPRVPIYSFRDCPAVFGLIDAMLPHTCFCLVFEGKIKITSFRTRLSSEKLRWSETQMCLASPIKTYIKDNTLYIYKSTSNLRT